VHTPTNPPPVVVRLARDADDVVAAQRLRYTVFNEDMGLGLAHALETGLDQDRWDAHCEHLIAERDGDVIGTYRLLPPDAAARLGHYADDEFDLTTLMSHDLRLLELGRSCVRPDARTGGVILQLLRGIALRRRHHEADALIGCVSIPGRDLPLLRRAWALFADRHLHPLFPLVTPRSPIDGLDDDAVRPDPAVLHDLPPLFKAYLRMGALVCGRPTWDPEFGTTDVFLMLTSSSMEAVATRLQRAA
jgi:putative hemolysin